MKPNIVNYPKESLETLICIALENCITAKGTSILDRFTALEIGQFASIIASYIRPNTIENKVYNTFKYLTSDEETEDAIALRFSREVKNCIGNLYKGNYSAENPFIFVKLIFYLIYWYHLETDGEGNLEKDIDHYQNFMLSHIIPNMEELHREIQEVKENGRTLKVDTGFIRVKEDNNYIPTTKTITNFKSLLE